MFTLKEYTCIFQKQFKGLYFHIYMLILHPPFQLFHIFPKSIPLMPFLSPIHAHSHTLSDLKDQSFQRAASYTNISKHKKYYFILQVFSNSQIIEASPLFNSSSVGNHSKHGKCGPAPTRKSQWGARFSVQDLHPRIGSPVGNQALIVPRPLQGLLFAKTPSP